MVEFSYNSARVVRSTNLAAAAYKWTEINSAMRGRGGFIYMDYNIYILSSIFSVIPDKSLINEFSYRLII